ncbi:oligoribonuclease [Porticoccus litoralis]|uniref:Oligoribonuclease n=1 Tax=Porticoccus litoralis TaxID=434086 RepID=A0AAW8B4I1_9GAMM|nr:oligoribonuclease [Porticoccus litoralis]MDP1520370.1 oligoribonuclease [Porticoccus litoralis]TNE89425.1 MAG: oligoribonuclease [Gammaproteobacteria bacterium]
MNDVLLSKDPLNLIWIDLEMTGLDTDNDVIIEIATIVTDKHLNILGEGPMLAIHQPDELLEGMDEWNTRQHGQSGLTERVRTSTISMAAAEKATLDFLSQFVDARQSPMCGNSICQDRRFLARQMPELEAFFHYRNLDVSSVKEIIRRWRPELLKGVSKQGAHLAMDDIKDSINELKYYRDVFFVMEEQP